ncbi:MAG: hypothetical protein ABJL67_08550 [Sulfitobacter sp.]
MTNPILERIERAEKKLPGIRSQRKKLEDAAKEDDGQLTPEDEEYKRITELDKQIAELERIVREQRKIFEDNKAKWEALASERAALESQVDELITWGDPEAYDVKSIHDKAEESAYDQCYADASHSFKEAQTSLKPIFEEYTKQSAAKKKYDDLLNQVHDRLDTLAGERVTSADAESSLAQIGTNLDTASIPVENRDYEDAFRLLEMNDPELALYDAEVARLVVEKGKAEKVLSAFQTRLAKLENDVADFGELVDRVAVVRGTEADIQSAMDSCQFDSVHLQITSNEYEMDIIGTDLVDMIAEKETKDAEFDDWTRRASRWAAFQTNVGELSDWKAPDAESFVTAGDEIQGYVTSEEYGLASEKFDPAEAQLNIAWEVHLEQKTAKTTYDGAVPGLSERATTAGNFEALDQALQDQLGAIETTLENMAIAAEENDYVSATQSIGDVTSRLDTLEQGIKEAELRKELAEEMGLDPNSSDPALEDELNSRLYQEEYPPLEQRVTDARSALNAEPLGFHLGQQVDQLETDLESITGIADEGDYAGAVAGVREGVKSINLFDTALSEQLERKAKFDDLHKRMNDDINRMIPSELKTVAEDAKELKKRSSEIINISGEGEYFNALNVLNHWDEQVQELSERNDKMSRLKTEVVPAWNALEPRYQAAMVNRSEEIAAAREAVQRSGAIVSNAVDGERYQEAKDELDNLRKNLEDFEPEAKLAEDHVRYEEALETLGLGELMQDMRSNTFPEAQEEMQACEAADTKRLDHEKAGEWGKACEAAFAQSTTIGKYTTKVVSINATKDTYDKGAPTLLASIDDFFPVEEEDTTGTIDKHDKIIKEVRERMELKVTEERWLEAVQILEELTNAFVIGEDEINKLFRASDDDIDGLIMTQMNIARNNVISPASDAVLKFEIFVRAEIAGERDFQKAAREQGYLLDIVAGVAAMFPPVGGMFAGAIKMGKAGGNWIVKSMDKDMDAAALAALNKLLAEIRKCLVAAEKQWDPNQGPWLKKNETELYEQIGRYLYNQKRASAIKALESYGAPITGSQLALQDQYYNQLRISYDDMVRG